MTELEKFRHDLGVLVQLMAFLFVIYCWYNKAVEIDKQISTLTQRLDALEQKREK